MILGLSCEYGTPQLPFDKEIKGLVSEGNRSAVSVGGEGGGARKYGL